MLVIRKAQMDALAEAQWREFAQTAFEHSWQRHEQVCAALGEAEVRGRVKAGLVKARSYGFQLAADLIRYLDFVFTIGPGFDREPWASEVLEATQYAPASRLDRLRRISAEQGSAPEPETPPPSLPDASWPEPQVESAPPPPQPAPPTEADLARPPEWLMHQHDEQYN